MFQFQHYVEIGTFFVFGLRLPLPICYTLLLKNESFHVLRFIILKRSLAAFPRQGIGVIGNPAAKGVPTIKQSTLNLL